MACKDKNKDKKIIAHWKSKKGQEKVIQEPEYEIHTWQGDLLDIQYLGIDLDRVVYITREEKIWTVQVINNTNMGSSKTY